MKRFGQREGGALPAGGPLAGCRATGRHGWECVRSAAMLFDMTRPICRNHWTATAFGGYYAQHTICLLWTCNRWQVDGMQRLVCVEGLACVRSLSTAPHPMPTPPRHPPPPLPTRTHPPLPLSAVWLYFSKTHPFQPSRKIPPAYRLRLPAFQGFCPPCPDDSVRKPKSRLIGV